MSTIIKESPRMAKLIVLYISIIGLLVGCNKADGIDCGRIDAAAPSSAGYKEIPLYMAGHDVMGSAKVKVYSAPHAKCQVKDRYLSVGEAVIAYAEIHGFTSIMLLPEVERGWVESVSLKGNGTGMAPKSRCSVDHVDVESGCKWFPLAPKTAAVLNDEQAYCDQKERSEFDKTHKRWDYFLIEAKGRTPLYSLPNEQCQSKKFLIQGDLVELIEFYPNDDFGESTYARVIYHSELLKSDVVGWISSNSLCRLTASGGNCEHIKRR
jgi:hypothetical protein